MSYLGGEESIGAHGDVIGITFPSTSVAKLGIEVPDWVRGNAWSPALFWFDLSQPNDQDEHAEEDR